MHRDSYWRDISLHDEEEESIANAQTQPLNIFYTQNVEEGGPAHRVGLKSGKCSSITKVRYLGKLGKSNTKKIISCSSTVTFD